MASMDPVSRNVLGSQLPSIMADIAEQQKRPATPPKQDRVELGVSGQPTLKTVLELLTDRINSRIESSFPGSEGITIDQQTLSMDWSPEAVSDRIIGFATAFFGAFQSEHEDMSEGEALDGFTNLIRGAIEKGFSQAREILNSMSLLNRGVSETVNRTYDLTMEKLDSFAAERREALNAE